jgi:hypothetical protein
MPDPYNLTLTGSQVNTAVNATYLLNLTAEQVNNAVNAAHDTADPVSQGSTKLVQGDSVYSAIESQLDARDTGAAVTDGSTHLVNSNAIYDFVVAKIRSKVGWAIYQDSQYTVGAPLVSNNANTQVTINGLGASTIKTYLPTGVTDLWSTVDNKIFADQLGDAYDIRLDFKANPTTASDYAQVVFDIGDGGGPLPVVSRTIAFATASSPSLFSIGFPIAALEDFMTNGCKIYFDTSTSADNIDFYDIMLFIKRDFNALT